jgi:hypothetical protein
MNQGVLYVASGEDFVLEATNSAQRVADIGNVPIAIVTDADVLSDGNPFDCVISQPKMANSWGIKPAAIQQTPFDQTIYLDTDTYVADPDALRDIFDLLDNNIPITLTHDTHASADHHYSFERSSVPYTYPWYNTGVIGFRMDRVAPLLESWVKYQQKFERQVPEINDQAAFRHAIYDAPFHPHVLPTEYNYRTMFTTILCEDVRIIHAHAANLEEIATMVNRGKMPRRRVCYSVPGAREFQVLELRTPTIIRLAAISWVTLRRGGLSELLSGVREYLMSERK